MHSSLAMPGCHTLCNFMHPPHLLNNHSRVCRRLLFVVVAAAAVGVVVMVDVDDVVTSVVDGVFVIGGVVV